MTVHADAEEASGPGPDTFDQGAGSDACDETQFDEKVAELGLEPMKAYVRVARGKKEISEAAEAKRKYRARRKAEGFEQYVVEVPKEAKDAVYEVARAFVADKTNSKNVRSTVLSVASSETLLELVQFFIDPGVDASSIIELIRRGDLAKTAAIRAARPALLDDIAGLAKTHEHFFSVLDCLVRHAGDISDASAKGLLEAAIAASGCPEALRFIEVRQRGGLRARLLGWALGGVR